MHAGFCFFLEIHSLACLFPSTRFEGSESLVPQKPRLSSKYEGCSPQDTTQTMALGIGLRVAGLLSQVFLRCLWSWGRCIVLWGLGHIV